MPENTERYRRLRTLFDEALQKEPSARESYLNQECAEDPELHPELLRLLAAHQKASSFLERPVELLPPPAIADDDFSGTDRFTVLRRLGSGGMGVVYEVQDRARAEIVALKTLRQATPAGVYRLKQEFRSLAGVTHPNVVCLYELVVEDAGCYFTMELVKGVNFVEYVRGIARSSLSIDRLTFALRQLVDGVSALHRLGKLHRDIKPSNVLVTPEGRVVILDFGLITELFPDNLGGAEHIIGGTPAYVSPEEGSGMPSSEAGDWYGVGATLYEALTGEIPFRGPPIDVLLRKREHDPPSPSELVPEVPANLSSICMGLMCRDPARRWSGRDVLSRLSWGPVAVPASEEAREPHADVRFVGRTRQLEVLDEAYLTVTRGRAAAVYVCGPSGIGKSALVRAFLGRLLARDDVVVLSGRCYEHESVPYKALDGVVDSLSRFMVSLPHAAAEGMLPDDIVALPRLFPVMLRVPAIARACREREPAISDPFLLRRLAFEVLRELLVRIARCRRLVLSIDDLQWADLDGALLLEELLRPPDAPALLTVVSFRSEEVAGKPFLRKLLEGDDRDMWAPLPLDPMPEPEARELISALLPVDSPLSEGQKLRITREAGGSPFVLEQLAHYAAAISVESTLGPTFAEMFDRRLGTLSPDARRFLETLAICGRPMAAELICAACGVAHERQSLVAMLRSAHFIRSSGSSERVETYHDRIREVVAGQIVPEAVRRIHSLMVQELVERGSDDCEALFEHYRGAGDSDNASIQAALAAAKAGAALAFDRAAFFYRHALTLLPTSSAAHAWKEGLANALANAGRPAEAAEAYLRAATGAGHAHRVELQRRGAEQFLIGGHIDRGLDLIRTGLAGIGVSVPRSPYVALLQLLWRRARLRWRGLHFVARPVDQIEADALLRIDTCWSATTGLMPVDMIMAADFSVHHLLMALDAGEPYRIARAMAMESAARGVYPTGRKLSERLGRQSKALATSVGNPHAIALSILADAIIATVLGEWKRASTLSEHALVILRDQCVGVTWEVNAAENLMIWSLMYQGALRELSLRVPVMLANARSRGNLYIATELCTRSNFLWLAADDPDEGEREAAESIARWSQKGFHRQHYSARLSRVQTALYRGNAEAAWQLHAEQEVTLRRSMLTRVQLIRVEALYLRSRVALAMAARNRSSRQFLSIARSGARRIARERMRWSDPIALLLRAAIAYLEGSTPLALTHLHDAAARFERADMKLYAAIARRRIGALQGDERGRELQRQGEEWMAAQHIKNPARMTRVFAPGFPDA
jgi:eukaryotic-like serine/threonine-protein kinase